MKQLRSYLGGTWTPGHHVLTERLRNPATGELMAEILNPGQDLDLAVQHALMGRRALEEMSWADRRGPIEKIPGVIKNGTEELVPLAMANGGKTRTEALFDIEGGRQAAIFYAKLAAGDPPDWLDGVTGPLGKDPDYVGQHLWVPMSGMALEINAYNFPVWAFIQKTVRAQLAGLPVVCRPARTTALVVHRLFEMLVEQKVFVPGTAQLYLGDLGVPGDLITHMGYGDVIPFTGSASRVWALRVRTIDRRIRLHQEADSLNTAVLGPDVEPGSPTFDMFVRHMVEAMTFMAGQMCTSFRRILVPAHLIGAVKAALQERLAGVKVGNPAEDGVTMGPVVSVGHSRELQEKLLQFRPETNLIFGDPSAPSEASALVGPILLELRPGMEGDQVHRTEVFGPVATLISYDGQACTAARIARLGRGSLVGGTYSNNQQFVFQCVRMMGADHGRIFLGDDAIAASNPLSPSMTWSALRHGGPGRAGEGDELGAWRGIYPFMNRVALHGHHDMVRAVVRPSVSEPV